MRLEPRLRNVEDVFCGFRLVAESCAMRRSKNSPPEPVVDALESLKLSAPVNEFMTYSK